MLKKNEIHSEEEYLKLQRKYDIRAVIFYLALFSGLYLLFYKLWSKGITDVNMTLFKIGKYGIIATSIFAIIIIVLTILYIIARRKAYIEEFCKEDSTDKTEE